MAKRLFDFLLALIGLAFCWPLFLLIALLIRLDSRGPVFFRQARIGRDGEPFRLFKFRTMVDNAYSLGPKLTQKRDPRITRIGQVLRWLKLDELPQLMNVLKGDMSFIGPRPEDPYFVSLYTEEERAVLSVRPGIVGPSQIVGRDELELYPEGVDPEQYYIQHILPEKLQRDLQYVRCASLWYDLKLLIGGVAVTVFGSFKSRYLRLNRQKVSLLALDTVLSLGAYLMAFGIMFDWTITPQAIPYLTLACASIVLSRPPCFIYFGFYQNILKYLGTTEFMAVVKAVTLGSILISANLFLLGFGSHSRAVLATDWMLLVIALFGYRLCLKARAEHQSRPRIPTLIVGVTNMGEHLAHELIRSASLPYIPVAFLDNDPLKWGALIHGVQVKGGMTDLAQVARLTGARMVLITYPNIPTNGDLREMIHQCRQQGLDYRTIPELDHLLAGSVRIPELHETTTEDLHNDVPSETNGNRNGSVEEGKRSAVQHRPRSILVTGGAGYVGSWLVRRLLERNYRVRLLDNFLYGSQGLRDLAGHPHLEIIEGDISRLGTVTRAVKGVRSVIALAALVGDAACELDPEETIAINYESIRILADVCRRQGVDRLVLASTCSVYGANPDLLLNEGSSLNPVSLYARTRLQAEEVLMRHSEHFSVVILRLATVFGLSARMRFDLLVNTLTLQAMLNRRIVVFGGEQWRPNLHVQDAADAFAMAVEVSDEKAHKGIFNVGSNQNNYTILQIANLVKKRVPKAKLEIKADATDRRDYRVSFDKIQYVLGFQPRFTVEDGISEIVGALDGGLIVDPTAEIYHNYRYLERHAQQAGAAVA